jgi:hypothetical protein
LDALGYAKDVSGLLGHPSNGSVWGYRPNGGHLSLPLE